MDKRELVCHIVSAEWTMFDKVHNCGGRACCQDDWGTFEIMRGSQMEAWPEDLLNSYLKDLREAAAEERNLLCEKYAYMMERTYPEEYEVMRNRLPVPSLEKIWLTEWICDAMIVWQEETAVCYPELIRRGRPIRGQEDRPGTVSFETYLRGELLTYSVETLRAYAAYIEKLKKADENICTKILKNMVCHYGYEDLSTAEEAVENQLCQKVR